MTTIAVMTRPSDEHAYRRAAGDIGQNIRQAREAVGMNQDEVAVHMGVSQSMVHHWESGRHVPGWDRLPRLCAFLGVSAHQVMEPVLGPWNGEGDLSVTEARMKVDVALRLLDRAIRGRDEVD